MQRAVRSKQHEPQRPARKRRTAKPAKRAIAIELIPDSEAGGFTARMPDIPAYGEGDTEKEAIADLKQALRGYIETFGLEDALNRLNAGMTVRRIALDLADLAHG